MPVTSGAITTSAGCTLDEAEEFAGLVRPGQVGVGVAQDAAFRFVGEEGKDTRAGLAPQRQVVVFQRLGLATVRDGVEV